jgi:hypothetical protein
MAGVMIREVLREQQPISIAEVGREVNKLRKEEGMKRINYHTVLRYVKEAERLGMLERVGTSDKDPDLQREGYENLSQTVLIRIKHGFTYDERWEKLPSIVAGYA